jgi:hypothetical protein
MSPIHSLSSPNTLYNYYIKHDSTQSIRMRNWNILFFFTLKNICCWIVLLMMNALRCPEKSISPLLFFIHLFIYAYIVWVISPPLFPGPSLPPPSPLGSSQNLFCPYLQFCWREDISNNKKDKAFLLVEIRIAIRRFQALLPCTCVLHLNWFISTSSLHYCLVTFAYWPQSL